jgi:hypothetical protein
MEEQKNYRILAQTLEEFKWLEAGYQGLIKNFKITGANVILVSKGFFFEGDKKQINISPLLDNEIQGVSKYGSNSGWNLIGSNKEEWDIQGKDCDYRIRTKTLSSLL